MLKRKSGRDVISLILIAVVFGLIIAGGILLIVAISSNSTQNENGIVNEGLDGFLLIGVGAVCAVLLPVIVGSLQGAKEE